MMTARDLYDRDFFEWTRCNAALLRAGQFDQADIEHIAEEIEDMGKRDRRELESRLEVLLEHLLKWQIQPDERSRSWHNTIEIQRFEIAKLVRKMPSLKPALSEDLAEAYQSAVFKASLETGLPEDRFPAACPFPLHHVLEQGFFPE